MGLLDEEDMLETLVALGEQIKQNFYGEMDRKVDCPVCRDTHRIEVRCRIALGDKKKVVDPETEQVPEEELNSQSEKKTEEDELDSEDYFAASEKTKKKAEAAAKKKKSDAKKVSKAEENRRETRKLNVRCFCAGTRRAANFNESELSIVNVISKTSLFYCMRCGKELQITREDALRTIPFTGYDSVQVVCTKCTGVGNFLEELEGKKKRLAEIRARKHGTQKPKLTAEDLKNRFRSRSNG